MTRKRKTRDTGHGIGKASTGVPGRDDAGQQPAPSEDFGRRRDIETADESAAEHDRRHHERGRADVESGESR